MELTGVIEQARVIAEQLGVKTVYGEPVVSGDTTVIPVASVAFGGGGGGGRSQEADKGGGGGGFGFRGWPAGYIEITPSGTRYVPVHEKRKLAGAMMVGIGIGMMLGRRRRR
jgi:uncharacterized spore protein YtfJ